MTLYRKRLYNSKAHWKARVKSIDSDMLHILNLERRGDLAVPILEFRDLAIRLRTLGELGERLVERAVKLGAGGKVIADMRDMCNHLDMLSGRLHAVAEAKWDQPLPAFPRYRTTLASTGELVSQSESIQELQRMTDGGEK